MTDKELIKQEIERLKHTSNAYDRSRFMLLLEIEEFIDSIPEEPSSEDLEEEINRVDDWYPVELNYIQEIAHHFVEWQKQAMKDALQTEYEKGRFDMQQEMMKDAVDGEYWDGSIYLDNRPTEYKDGDKMKIIIVKTE